MEYLKNQKAYLLNYLKDGRLEISNNRAERSIKPFVIDRKNFLFANTPGGAQSSAVIFSLIQTSIENGLDPWRYLTWLIDAATKDDVDADGRFPGLHRTFAGFQLNLIWPAGLFPPAGRVCSGGGGWAEGLSICLWRGPPY